MATNAIIPALEAKELGLVNHVIPDGELNTIVSDMASQLANGPYLAIQHTKSNIRAGFEKGLAAALDQEAINQGENFLSLDFFEGIAAFLEKRKANFRGE